jgi:hypothetical protein
MDWFGHLLSTFTGQLPGELYSMFSGSGGGATGGRLPTFAQMQKELQEMYGQGREDISGSLRRGIGYEMPFLRGGTAALGTYLGTLGLGGPGARRQAMQQFQTSPGYQYQLQQGTQAAERAAASRGLMGSGAEQQALQRVGQQLANQQYGSWQNRLASLTGLGAQTGRGMAGQQLQGGTSLAQLGLGYGRTLADLYSSLAGTQARELPYQMQGLSQFGQGIGQMLPYIFQMFGG